jgi:ribosomal protein S18 acetylase RimI-like enzyme
MMTANVFDSPAITRPDITIEPMVAGDLDEVLGVLARGMRDNPVHVGAFGAEAPERERLLRTFFGMLSKKPEIVENARVARLADGRIAGIYGSMNPGSCQPKPIEKLLMAPMLLGSLGLGNGRRVMRWLGTWSKHDPDTRHCHFGPIAVDAGLQGQGIGTAMMRSFCAEMDAAGEAAYLETDKESNVRFYNRFGFEVVTSDEVLGVTNWYMIREPKPAE